MAMQSIELSDALMWDAQVAAGIEKRTVENQIEHWVSLGRVVDRLLKPEKTLAWQLSEPPKPLSECLLEIETPAGQLKVKEYLDSLPFPHFEGVAGQPDLLTLVEEDGTRTNGRFVKRQFMALTPGES